MTKRFGEFDRSRIVLSPLSDRCHDLDLSAIKPLKSPLFIPPHMMETFSHIAGHVRAARNAHAPVILMIGAHVLRAGVQRYLFDMMDRGWVTAIAMNGACAIHDYEFALIGATTESVAKYIIDGRFGMWEETGQINDIVTRSVAEGKGFGEAVGEAIAGGDFPYADISLFAKCSQAGVLATVHVGVGYDIIHSHPNMNPRALGEASYRDFLRFAHVVENLEGGVVMNFGSAVMGPEIFLKALSMARNIATTEGKTITDFTSLVCDLQQIDTVDREPAKTDSRYYFRPWKTLLARAIAGGGRSYYVQGYHGETIPALWSALSEGQ